MTGLASHIVPGGVLVGLSPATSAEVIDLLAGELSRQGRVLPSWAAAAKAREAEMPTGLDLGGDFAVAVPHTDPDHVAVSGVAVAVLDHPVTFASMDDPDQLLPARVVFALALRSKDEQIEMLQAVGRLLQDGARLRRLSESRDPEEARSLLAEG